MNGSVLGTELVMLWRCEIGIVLGLLFGYLKKMCGRKKGFDCLDKLYRASTLTVPMLARA